MQVSPVFANVLAAYARRTAHPPVFEPQDPHTLCFNPIYAYRVDEVLLHPPEDLGGMSLLRPS